MLGLAASGYATICYAEAPKEPLHVVELSTHRPRMHHPCQIHFAYFASGAFIFGRLFIKP
jgi:hypothetical protein